MQKKKEAASEELYGELGRIFDFTEADLGVNRTGFVSHRQRTNLRERFPSLVATLIAILFICNLAIFIPLALVGWSRPCYGDGVSGGWCALTISLCISSPAIIGFLWLIITYFMQMQETETKNVFGQVTPRKQVTRGATYYSIICNKEEFMLDEEHYEFPWKTSPYSIYYLPYRNRILSIEEVSPEEG